VLIVFKSGSLNLLEPSGPVQACNGIYLSLRLKNLDCFAFSTTEEREKFRLSCGTKPEEERQTKLYDKAKIINVIVEKFKELVK
jgi:hypothetical protein